MIGFEQALGIHTTMVELRSQRAKVLAANLANADTPHYKARDIDFQSVFAGIESGRQLTKTRTAHLGLGGRKLHGAELMYRLPAQASLDQNTVEIDAERSKFLDNAMRYQASLRFLDGKFSGIRAALRGE